MKTQTCGIDGFKLDCGQVARPLPLIALPMLLTSAALITSSIVVAAIMSIDIARAGLT
jgi:hypothetical protein